MMQTAISYPLADKPSKAGKQGAEAGPAGAGEIIPAEEGNRLFRVDFEQPTIELISPLNHRLVLQGVCSG